MKLCIEAGSYPANRREVRGNTAKRFSDWEGMYRLKFGTTKYHNKKQEYGGHFYMSKLEADVAWQLDMRIKAKEIKSYERQVRIPLTVKGKHICDYIIDFVVQYPDGTTEYLEAKGFETDVWKLKWKLFEAIYEDKKNVRLTVQRR